MKILNNLKIAGSRERAILFDVFYQETKTAKPLVIFCHGFKGFKDWGPFNLMSKSIAAAGFVVSKFNFSHNGGTEEDVIDFPDLEAFGNNNISTELNDLGLFIDAWTSDGKIIPDEEVDRSNIILIGHSRGGGVCILKAAEDARVTKLITLAAIGSVGRLFTNESLLNQWKERGVIYIPNGRTLQQMPMYYQYYEDYIENKERLDIPAAASKINIPWLIVHGEDDPTVPVSTAFALNESNPKSEKFIVAQANHTFGGKHPWEETSLPHDTQLWLDKAFQFLKSN